MILLAESLFRLDVALSGDTLRTVVRNLSSGELETNRTGSDESGVSIAIGDGIAAHQPGRASVDFALGTGQDRVTVKTTIATLHVAERGTIRVTAQAIVRQVPEGS